MGEFHKNRNNNTVFEELSVSIVDLTNYFFSGRNLKSAYISSFFICFQTSVYTLEEFHRIGGHKYPLRVASKTAFATIKSTIDTSNSSNTVWLFLKQRTTDVKSFGLNN
jgi:hypothetical protein